MLNGYRRMVGQLLCRAGFHKLAFWEWHWSMAGDWCDVTCVRCPYKGTWHPDRGV